jgi:hypothetical protein
MYRFASFLLLLATTANCHTWIEQLTVVAPNGTYVGAPGYIRGNVKRDAPGFGDPLMVNLLPPDGGPNTLLPTDLMCKSTQTSQTQTDGSPRLQAAPGAAVALRWQENGHVTLPQNQPGKPANRGNVYVYATSDPKDDDTFLGIHEQWNPEGTGGDKRGKLLSVSSYDDGRCYQVNGGAISTQRQTEFSHTPSPLTGADLWCQQNFALPADAPDGKPLTLYWVWSWNTQAGIDPGLPNGKTEIYTSCLDIDIALANNSGAAGPPATVSQSQTQYKYKSQTQYKYKSQTQYTDKSANKFQTETGSYIQGQDLNFAAIPDQMAKLGQTIVGNATIDNFDSSNSKGPATAPESSGASASSQSSSSSIASQPSSNSSPAPAAPVPTSTSASSSAQSSSKHSSSSSASPTLTFQAPAETPSLAASASATSSSVAPAVSAMNAPGGPSVAGVVTVTVTDYVPASTVTPVASPSDGVGVQVPDAGKAKRSTKDAKVVAALRNLGGNAKFAPLRAVYHH